MRIATAVAVACLSVVGLAVGSDAEAVIRQYELNIPKQSLDMALRDLAQQTGLQIALFSDSIDGNAQVGPVLGAQSAEQALKTLLAPSGLSYKIVSAGAIAVLSQADSSQNAGSKPLQPLAAPSGDLDDQATKLEEVIVTASKRKENAQDVPVSMSVLGGDQLERLHASSLQDYAAYVPGLIVDSGGTPGQATISLRGLYPQSSTAMVATYIDEAPLGSSNGWAGETIFAFDMMPYDLERVEILRGPQGTLYGANSMGGLLKYVTRSPNLHEFEARAGGETFTTRGSGNPGYAARAGLNLPIRPGELALRASLYGQETPGYIDNFVTPKRDQNDLSQQGGRLALLWQASDDISVKISATSQSIDSDGNANVRLTTDGVQAFGPIGGDLTDGNAVAEPFKKRVDFFASTVNWHLGSVDFTSASSYSDTTTRRTSDATDSFGALIPLITDPPVLGGVAPIHVDLRLRRFTQEFRLASPSGERFEWMLGAYCSDERSKMHQVLDALDGGTRAPIAGVDPLIVLDLPSHYREVAGFANATYKFTDAFDLTAGMRNARNKQSTRHSKAGNPLFGEPSDDPGSSSESVFTYAVSPRYRLNQDVMLYARVATGYRPGGPNAVLTDVPPQVNSDSTINYEMGIKALLLNRQALFNFSVFRVDWKDIQLQARTDAGLQYSTNGKTARSQGVELATAYSPTRGLQLGFNAAYTDSFLTAAVESQQWSDKSTLPSAPKWSGSATASYEFPVSTDWSGRIGGGYRYVGRRFSGVEHTPYVLRAVSYNVLDLNAGLFNERWNLTFYARNGTDARIYATQSMAASPFGVPLYVSGALLQPRTVGISLDTSF